MYAETAACRPTFERTLTLGSQQLRVSIRGEGEGLPLLMLNGVGGSLELFDDLRRAVGRQTIAFDAPGTGGSETPLLPITIGGHARLALRLLDRLGVSQVDILGLSFGGLVAQELARRAPARIERLVLASTSCGWGGVPSFPVALLDLAAPQDCYAQAAPHRKQRVDLRGYLYQLWAASQWSSLAWLHDVAQPTLVLAGGADLLVPPFNADILVAMMPHARKIVVPGGGHLFLLEDHVMPAAQIDEFLTRPALTRAGRPTASPRSATWRKAS